jgi:hypothetical protein
MEVCRALYKCDYCVPGDILIDDRPQYRDRWEKAGGAFIHHTSAKESISELRSQLPADELAKVREENKLLREGSGDYIKQVHDETAVWEEEVAELKARVAELEKRECPYVHCICGACGGAIRTDGGCDCQDNRKHPVASVEHLVRAELATAQARVEQLERERDAWSETANRHCRNEDYYRGLVVAIGKLLGPEAYISDDGSVQQDVLCAKVPEIVAAEVKHNKALEQNLQAARDDYAELERERNARYYEGLDDGKATVLAINGPAIEELRQRATAAEAERDKLRILLRTALGGVGYLGVNVPTWEAWESEARAALKEPTDA